MLCFVVISGWYVWDNLLWQSGEDQFPESFWQSFDTEFIINHIDVLRDSGHFRYMESDEISYPQKVAIWPSDSNMDSLINGMVEVNANIYYKEDRKGAVIRWDTSNQCRRFYEDWQSDEKMTYKYIYDFLLTAPQGQIRLSLAANTREECMNMAQEELLWLMSVASGDNSIRSKKN